MISAYNGNEPYIFISYAHKDAHLVMPILEKMWENGFRIWYDKDIQGGFEWPEFIANKLFDSSCVLAFISRSAIDSKNCRREINFAIAKDKPLLAVYLDNSELPLGMQLQLDTLQALFCTTPDEIDALIQKFQVTEVLLEARVTEQPVAEEQNQPIPEEPTVEEQSQTTPEAPIAEGPIAEAQSPAVPEEIAEEEPATTQEPEPSQPALIPEQPAAPEREEPQVREPWRCSCGRVNPGNKGKCDCGNWRCVCGKIHASYMSSCSCGRNKWGEITTQPVRYAAIPKVERPKAEPPKTAPPPAPIGWNCPCGRIHSKEVRKCVCGNWHCTCGKVHPSYLSSCSCGNDKWSVVRLQQLEETTAIEKEYSRKPVEWGCICGRTNPEEVRKCECGSWRCACGKINREAVRECECGSWRCTCGRINPEAVQKCECGSWRCACGRINPEEVRKCECGSWQCTCGKIHASYISNCACGSNKWRATLAQLANEATAVLEKIFTE